ncbi:uncharacterized protein si:ch211-51h4.2 [Tachysurus vachellii]|uniref:uncharacterized protein si:ch211-51h4.2 n=1 Tax=Tachysurus vachellii TaxID=175792 RepID=UPI00296B1F06|nr:uncharacterized protein si:ch211-51h4.2 [Tachysurus vachellii]XP_060720773.1 uncharacterized protein si:ch211-51h4.2 [Tachysurus vachellii]
MEAAEEEVCQCSGMEEKSEKRQTSPVCYSRERKQRSWKRSFIYLQCYFLTVATILGTGILGLPVTIARAGLIPFLVSFLIGFLMQALLIYLFVDLLQRCRVIQMESVKSLETEGILMQNVSPVESPVLDSEEVEESEDVEDADAGLLQKDNTILKLQEELHPNLHVLGVLFLSKRSSQAFTLILLFHFVSIGISYVLAGSEAYASLFHTSHIYVIPVFTWTLSLGILLAQVIIQPITSLLTLLKGILLIITVAVTFVVGSEVHQETKNDFTQIGKPFLMGTVALGGIVNVMPFLFSEIYHNKTQVLWFRRALLGGLTTCTILNILWCWAVVDIVPQMAVKPVLEEKLLNTSLVRMETTRPAHTFIYSNISLEESEKAGEIATIPLTKIINQRYTHFSWVAELIQIFITISITVSFLVMGSAMKHTIDGLVNRQWEMNAGLMLRTQPRTLPEIFNTLRMRSVSGGFLSFLVFGIIFVVSICDPKGFVVMLDKVVSFSLNTEVGLFIFLMLRASRSVSFKHMTVPLPVGESLFRLHWLLPVYFLFAVAYDLSLCVLDISKNMYHSSQTNRSLV